MIKAKLIIEHTKEEVSVLIRNRQYKKLILKIEKLSFWQKLKLLFGGNK